MWNRIVRAVSCAGAALLFTAWSAAPAAAQPPQRGGAATGGRGVSPAEITQMLNAVTLMRAQEVLQLRDDQYAPFLERLRALQAVRQRSGNQRNRIIRELRTLAQSADPASEAEMKARLGALREHDVKAAADVQAAWDRLDEVLDVRQRARFRVLEQDQERRHLELLLRARGAARGR